MMMHGRCPASGLGMRLAGVPQRAALDPGRQARPLSPQRRRALGRHAGGPEKRGVMPPPEDDRDDVERLGDSTAFRVELERLAELGPEPWATKLRAILDEELAR
jgi:hypothetical protein